jgi:metal-responsive CopG/Arc/MetJ family transcriptional regulator
MCIPWRCKQMLTANRSVERVTISVPHELASEADSCSAELKVSRSELYKLALERFLAERRRERLKLIVAEMAEEYRADKELTALTVLDTEEFV